MSGSTNPDGRQARTFDVHERLGQGGFGEVYRATMMSSGGLRSEVAVKVLRDPTGDAIRRLRDEGRLLAALRHPAILKVHDLIVFGDQFALVTEYIEGADLAELVSGTHPISRRAAVEAIGAVADALHGAWATVPPGSDRPLHLVHRDLKPSNIRLGRHAEVKLLDFGIAWSGDSDRQAHTQTSMMVGSLPYMAPERFALHPPDGASDVFSLGATLFEIVTAERLHPTATPLEMMARSADQPRHQTYLDQRFAETRGSGMEPELEALIRRMLAHDPAQRPDSAEIAAACEALVDKMSGERLKGWCRAHPWPPVGAGPGPLTGQVLSDAGSQSAYIGIPTRESAGDPLDGATLSMPMAVPGATPSATATPAPAPSLEPARPLIDPRPEEAHTLEQPAPAPPQARSGLPVLPLGLAGVGLIAVLGWMAWSAGGSVAEPEPEPVATEAAAPAPAPVPAAPEPQPEPAPGTAEPVATTTPAPAAPVPAPAGRPAPAAAPKPAPAPEPEPAVEAPPPVPEAAPAPAPVALGRVALTGDGKIELRSAAGTFSAGDLPAGTYEVWVDFGQGMNKVRTVQVLEGATVTVRCNGTRWTCSVGD